MLVAPDRDQRVCPLCNSLYPRDVSHCKKDGTPLSPPTGDSPGIEELSGDTDADSTPPSSASSETFGTGDILGSYRLLDLLGEGGMGCVYLAEHIRLGRKVALKLLRSEYANNSSAVHRFFTEARSVNQICHDNIVEITDFIAVEGGASYCIMELLTGRTLSQEQASGGIMPLPRALRIAIQVCSALAAAHKVNIVHRDLKPGNIFLTERGGQKDFVKLLDFGIAKLTDEPDDLAGAPECPSHARTRGQTHPGSIMGTPEYMSPEQASGKPVTYGADIYSFGVILYEMVTGRKPFVGKSLGEFVIKHLTVLPVRASRVENLPFVIPPELDDLIMSCLEKSPHNRPSSMAEVGLRILEVARKEALPLDSYSLQRRSASLGWILAGVLIVALGAGGIWILLMKSQGAAGRRMPLVNFLSTDTDPGPRAATIELTLDSKPRGAEVFRSGESAPLGRTPLTLSFLSSGRSEVFEFRHAGFQNLSRVVSFARNGQVMATLSPLDDTARASGSYGDAGGEVSETSALGRDRSKRQSSGRRHKKQRRIFGSTIDPFLEK